MPTIFLSPSTQEYNPYVTGAGSEEYFMNLLADAMEPLLLANGIRFVRNDPQGTVGNSIRQSNADSYDFHLALHSNASGSGSEGQNRGIIAFYYPGSVSGQRAAELVCVGPAGNLSPARPGHDPLRRKPDGSCGAPRPRRCCWSWATTTMPPTPCGSRSISASSPRPWCQALTEYFGLPYVCPGPSQTGLAVTDSGGPSTCGAIPPPRDR